MAKKGNGTLKNGTNHKPKTKPRSPALFERGIRSDADAIEASFAAAADVGYGRMAASNSNAMAAHVRNALKIVEARYKYATKLPAGGRKSLFAVA